MHGPAMCCTLPRHGTGWPAGSAALNASYARTDPFLTPRWSGSRADSAISASSCRTVVGPAIAPDGLGLWPPCVCEPLPVASPLGARLGALLLGAADVLPKAASDHCLRAPSTRLAAGLDSRKRGCTAAMLTSNRHALTRPAASLQGGPSTGMTTPWRRDLLGAAVHAVASWTLPDGWCMDDVGRDDRCVRPLKLLD